MIHRRSRVPELAARRISNVPRAFVGMCVGLIIFGYLGGTIRAAEIVGLPPITIYNMRRNAIRPTDDVKDFIQRWLSPKQLKTGENLFPDEFI